MGLDMYAYITRNVIGSVDFKIPDDAVKIAYWRKHPDLHGWMEALYTVNGGCQVFNCQCVQLDKADIDALEIAVNRGELPLTSGFFFGESLPDDKADDLLFISAARDALAAGYRVFYYSWW